MALIRTVFIVLSLLMSQVSHADAPQPSSLEELRAQIDYIDNNLLALLDKRMGIVWEIGAVKRETEVPAYDPEREQKILQRLYDLNPVYLTRDQIRDIWVTLMIISKESQ